MKIMSGNSNRPLAESVASYLKTSLLQASIHCFADGEVFVEIEESVRGDDVFIIQPTSAPTNDTLMELLVTMDALKRGGAQSITAVIPYYGYGRQDRKTGPCSPISAKLVANLLTVAGANRILAMDWHSSQIQGFFEIHTEHLTAAPLFCEHIKENYNRESIVIVSPDVGGLTRARVLAENLGVPMAIIDKRRIMPGVAEVLTLIGDVSGRLCILIDDMVDSAGTLCQAAKALEEAGAQDIDAYVSHGVLSGAALEKIEQSNLRRLVITDTIQPAIQTLQSKKVEVLSVAAYLAQAISGLAHNEKVSNLIQIVGKHSSKGKKGKLAA